MTVPRVIEMMFAAEAFIRPPEVGSFYASQSGLSALSVSKVRRVVGDRSGPRYRLIGLRVRLCDMPVGAALLPWPKTVKKASAAALPVFGPPQRSVRQSEKKTEERRRAVALLRDDRDSNRVVHKVRVDNNTAIASEWRDNEDTNPNRRHARVVHGYKARDSIQVLLDNGSITRGHASAGRRFRKEYELGSVGLRQARDLSAAPSGFASGTGPSESRSRALEAWNTTSTALMPHLLEVMMAIVIAEETMLSYAQRKRQNRTLIAGYLMASFDTLKFIYAERDKADDKHRRETIGPGLGPDPRDH